MAATGQGIAEEKQYNFLAPLSEDFSTTPVEEIALLKKELDSLKSANPFRIAELALELQIERLRVVEISNARDAALHRLSDACTSIRQKNDYIRTLMQDRNGEDSTVYTTALDRNEIEELKAHISTQEQVIAQLRSSIQQPQVRPPLPSKPSDLPPCYEETATRKPMETSPLMEQPIGPEKSHFATVKLTPNDPGYKYVPPDTDNPAELVNARNMTLMEIPLPDNPPDATLSAVIIPPPFTLHEFLGGAPAALRNALSNYRILHNVTTLWCPDREEHGYMYVPAFKCSTNPRIATAHRWAPIDVVGRMDKPTECFYNKEGIWYYAGSYKAFKLDYLSTKEWMQLPPETISAIVKETIAGRKNSSPQNTYETSQLYASGALKVACVGLQCVGFNQEVYKSILEHSTKFSETKWKSLAAASVSPGIASPTPNSGTSVVGTPTGSGHTTPNPLVKTPINVRHLHRALGSMMSSSSSESTGSPASTHLSTPGSGILGLGSSLWHVAVSPSTPMSPCVTVDAAAKKVFEGGENMAVVEHYGEHYGKRL